MNEAESKQITPFAPSEPAPTPSARLNQIVGPLNQLIQQFNERRRHTDEFGEETVIIKIIGALDTPQAGYYKAQILHEPGIPASTDDLAEDQIGVTIDDDTTNDAVARNIAEIGGGDTVDVDTYHIARIAGTRSDGIILVDFSPGGGGGGGGGVYQFTLHIMAADNTSTFDYLLAGNPLE